MINRASQKSAKDKVRRKYETHERYIIEQEKDWAEALTFGLCTSENNYKVIIHQVLSEEKQIMTINEKSDAACRY